MDDGRPAGVGPYSGELIAQRGGPAHDGSSGLPAFYPPAFIDPIREACAGRMTDLADTNYEDGSYKRVDAYNVNPNIFRTLRTGQAVLKSVVRNGHALVDVHLDQD